MFALEQTNCNLSATVESMLGEVRKERVLREAAEREVTEKFGPCMKKK
jgi:hypothetical protein